MDLQHLRASDGTGEAVLAHIQSVRNPGSTVLDLDNVDNWNSKAVIITGTPAANGFISPVGMKVMYGHLNAGDFIIDGYAPGYADNGNTTSEVAIVKMTTSWADALVTILQTIMQDNGLLKTTALDNFYRPSEVSPINLVPSGGVIAISAGLTGTFSNIVYYYAGLRYSKTGIANKTYTASKDTYVSIDTSGNVSYSEVANNAAVPSLPVNSIWIAKVITNGTNITKIIRMAMRHISEFPRFSTYRLGATNSSNSLTIIPFETIIHDSHGGFDTSTFKYTVPVTGNYAFDGLAGNLAASGMIAYCAIYVNGTIKKQGQVSIVATSNNRELLAAQIYLQAGDQVEMRYVGGGGSTMAVGPENLMFEGAMTGF